MSHPLRIAHTEARIADFHRAAATARLAPRRARRGIWHRPPRISAEALPASPVSEPR